MSAKQLKNLATEDVYYDTLHLQGQRKPMRCHGDYCSGSSMGLFGTAADNLSAEYVEKEAPEFIRKFCTDNNRTAEMESRTLDVLRQLSEGGTYELTMEELEWGARMAWRNSPRCPGRIQWRNLKFFDCRRVTNVDEAFAACCNHIVYSTNGGNIRPAITVFPPRKSGENDKIRIWNNQLITYAGYETTETPEVVVGDKGNVKFTKFCQRLGWKGAGGSHDVLPLVISDASGCPKLFELPEEIVLRVAIHHQSYPALSGLDMQWFALPAVSGMGFEIGGLQFPCSPFSGWYSLPEIATRNFMDRQRYDLSLKVAKILKMDTSSNLSMWRDKVNIILSEAVLNSFNKAGVTIVDQHTQGEQFMTFFKDEHKVRGGCPADWVWINPPQSGSLTEVFHQEMLNYQLTPRFDYQKSLASSYRFSQDRKPTTFRAMIAAILFAGLLLRKHLKPRKTLHVIYASETGTAKKFANSVKDFLSEKIIIKISNMRDLSLDDLIKTLGEANAVTDVLFLVSTFGSGEPPADGASFYQSLKAAVEKGDPANEYQRLRFSCFALGSSVYPTFCGFGKDLDKLLESLGSKRLLPIHFGDEISGQEKSFQIFMQELCYIFGGKGEVVNVQAADVVGEVAAKGQMTMMMVPRIKVDPSWIEAEAQYDVMESMRAICDHEVCESIFLHRHTHESGRFFLIRLNAAGLTDAVSPGDHIAIFPRNREEDVERIAARLTEVPAEDAVVMLAGGGSPSATFKELLTAFYSISGPVTKSILTKIQPYLTQESDRAKVNTILKSEDSFDAFSSEMRQIVDLFDLFPSLTIDAARFVALLDHMRPRWYSIANVPFNDKVIELEAGLVKYKTPAGELRKGLCTNYFKTLPKFSKVICFHKKNPVFPRCLLDQQRCLLMIANGSGIAPFRGIWQHRRRMNVDSSQTLLFFGCRDKTENLFFDESRGIMKRFTAYSREFREKKQYVQALIFQHRKTVIKMILEEEGTILVCGTPSMASGVRKALDDIFNSVDGEQQQDQLQLLRKQRRYMEEVFM